MLRMCNRLRHTVNRSPLPKFKNPKVNGQLYGPARSEARGGHRETTGREATCFLSVTIQRALHPAMATAVGEVGAVETLVLDSAIPWEGNSKSSSPSNDKLSKLEAHTVN